MEDDKLKMLKKKVDNRLQELHPQIMVSSSSISQYVYGKFESMQEVKRLIDDMLLINDEPRIENIQDVSNIIKLVESELENKYCDLNKLRKWLIKARNFVSNYKHLSLENTDNLPSFLVEILEATSKISYVIPITNLLVKINEIETKN